ncbi:MAG: BatD family protein [Saprospiraceae bacterium]
MNFPGHTSARTGLRCSLRALWGCLLVVGCPLAAQPTFVASSESPEVVEGSRFEVSFALKDGEGTNFRAPAFPNFKVLSGPNLSSGMTIVNGNYFVHRTWSYMLEARSTGNFTLKPARITVNGRPMSSNSLPIRVVAARTGNSRLSSGADEELFIAGELSDEEARVGQQITYWVKLYTLISLEGYDLIELPDFQGFYAKDLSHFDTRVQYQNLRGRKYAVKILHAEAIFPQESGEQVIGTARVRVGVERSGPLGRLGPLPQILQTQPVRLRVKSLPEPPPERFSGGVGQFGWECSIDRDSLSTDDALTLRIRLRGNGDPKSTALPVLTLPAGLEAFEPKVVEEEDYENGQAIIHRKTLEYAILPREPGEYDLLPEFVVFDPDSNRYVTIQADTLLHFRVSVGKNYQATQPGLNPPALPIPPSETNGLWDQVLQLAAMPWIWGALAALVVVALLFSWLNRRRRAIAARPVALPPVADRNYREQFGQARKLMHGADPRIFYDVLLRALQNYLASRLGLPLAQLNVANVRYQLAERRVPEAHVQHLLGVWQACEQALFAGQVNSMNPETTLQNAEQLVQTLEHDLRSKS